jgi:hypothetical protein
MYYDSTVIGGPLRTLQVFDLESGRAHAPDSAALHAVFAADASRAGRG